MGQSGFDDGVARWGGFKPVKKSLGLRRQGGGGRGFKVHIFSAHIVNVLAGDHLHGAAGIGAPCGHGDACAPAVAGGEQCRVPAKQALGREGLVKVLGGVEHHVHHTVHVAVCGGKRTNVHAQPAGDGGAHGVQIQRLTFDGAGGDDFLG